MKADLPSPLERSYLFVETINMAPRIRAIIRIMDNVFIIYLYLGCLNILMVEEEYTQISLAPELEEIYSLKEKFLGKHVLVRYSKDGINQGILETINDSNIVLNSSNSLIPLLYRFNLRLKEISEPEQSKSKVDKKKAKESQLETAVKR